MRFFLFLSSIMCSFCATAQPEMPAMNPRHMLLRSPYDVLALIDTLRAEDDLFSIEYLKYCLFAEEGANQIYIRESPSHPVFYYVDEIRIQEVGDTTHIVLSGSYDTMRHAYLPPELPDTNCPTSNGNWSIGIITVPPVTTPYYVLEYYFIGLD